MIFAIATTIACASSKEKKPSLDKEYAAFKNVSTNDSLFASAERGFCFGKCPVYKMNIYNSGYATYEGIRNVEMLGTYSGKFTPQQMNELIASAEGISFFSLDENYDNPNVTDLPSATMSIVINAKRHQVKYRAKFPPELRVFQTVFEDMNKEVSWKLEKAFEE